MISKNEYDYCEKLAIRHIENMLFRITEDDSLDTHQLGILEEYFKSPGSSSLGDKTLSLHIAGFDFYLELCINAHDLEKSTIRTYDHITQKNRLKDSNSGVYKHIPELDFEFKQRVWQMSNNDKSPYMTQYCKRLIAYIDKESKGSKPYAITYES